MITRSRAPVEIDPTAPLPSVRLPEPFVLPTTRLALEAAVAVVLRGPSLARAEVLLVRRAARPGDPWSGDMALPGGRRGPEDRDLAATARRETREEVGLALEPHAALIGRLRQVFTIAPSGARRVRPMVVSPYVFALASPDVPPLTLSHEVAGTRWVPLAALMDPALRARRPWRLFGVTWPAPAWRLGDDLVWGLTHQMLSHLLRATSVAPPR